MGAFADEFEEVVVAGEAAGCGEGSGVGVVPIEPANVVDATHDTNTVVRNSLPTTQSLLVMLPPCLRNIGPVRRRFYSASQKLLRNRYDILMKKVRLLRRNPGMIELLIALKP